MHKCPKCGHESFSKSIKLSHGPALSKECENCHAQVSVPYWSALIMPLTLTKLFILNRLHLPRWLRLPIPILAFTFALFVYYKYVPLIVKLQEGEEGYMRQKIANAVIFILSISLMCSVFYFS
ncbi:hypothetical protein EZV73_09725 [Acidaminobacter sp. JC074]|uniref:hypothetical protein n=1 Tax=Acidaminobacter sp. JC074 TaxID=2530199 RepID=UPI001F0D53CB|nr:hypothetical protein [Acidaminobacter sp. JC074]MCH4887852.1 hypothetical protein [Acidaminobacter sp. JC074]